MGDVRCDLTLRGPGLVLPSIAGSARSLGMKKPSGQRLFATEGRERASVIRRNRRCRRQVGVPEARGARAGRILRVEVAVASADRR